MRGSFAATLIYQHMPLTCQHLSCSLSGKFSSGWQAAGKRRRGKKREGQWKRCGTGASGMLVRSRGFTRALRASRRGFGGALRLIGEARSERLMRPVERAAKQLFFDCQMCGQCVLSESGMACPTQLRENHAQRALRRGECQRRLRSQAVDALRLGRGHGGAEAHSRAAARAAKALRPIDQRLKDSSTWIRIIKGQPEAQRAPALALVTPRRQRRRSDPGCPRIPGSLRAARPSP